MSLKGNNVNKTKGDRGTCANTNRSVLISVQQGSQHLGSNRESNNVLVLIFSFSQMATGFLWFDSEVLENNRGHIKYYLQSEKRCHMTSHHGLAALKQMLVPFHGTGQPGPRLLCTDSPCKDAFVQTVEQEFTLSQQSPH